tara:strand:- start:7236 stop:8369 length:1134 start_codon:yes stop_codon:yes gene_type:complete
MDNGKEIRKIAIISEFLSNIGGIEKSILSLVKELKKKKIDFDIYAGFYDPENTYEEFKQLNVKVITRKRFSSGLNVAYLRWKFAKMKLTGYDGFVIFGSHSIAAAKNNHPNIWWSTRPLKYLYGIYGKGPDESNDYLYKGSFIKKFIISQYIKILTRIDKKQIKDLDIVTSCGLLAERRLKQAYPGLNHYVVYQPIDLEKYKYISKGAYYLAIARMVRGKNVDKIIAAFKKMPEKKLIIAGRGPLLDEMKKRAKGCKNIELLGFVDEEKLHELNGKCIASIGACNDQDYSMNLMEANACGKPTISIKNTDEDKEKEGMVVSETGVTIESTKEEDFIEAVNYLDINKAEKMKKACLEKSNEFSEETFFHGMVDPLRKW